MEKTAVFTILLFCRLFTGHSQELKTEPFSDCSGAVILCDKSDLLIRRMPDSGQEMAEIGFTTCSNRLEERHSIWMKWQIASQGSIEFILESLQASDDLDFVLYRLDSDIRGCSHRYEVRCMASGDNIGAPDEESLPCKGITGMYRNVSDENEGNGCGDSQDNFLAPITANEGENYLLYINNFTSANGFKLEWKGSATFRTPKEIHTPDLSATLLSKSVYLKSGTNGQDFFQRTNWTEGTMDRGFLGRMSAVKTMNTFVGCLPQKEALDGDLAEKLKIGQLFPNPSTQYSKVAISSPFNGMMRVQVFDLLGRLHTNREYQIEKGEQTLDLSAEYLAAGFYAVHFKTGDFMECRKLIVAVK